MEGLLAQAGARSDAASGRKKLSPEEVAALQSRKAALEEKRQALYLTLRQFDPEFSPAELRAVPFKPRRSGKDAAGKKPSRKIR